MFRLHTAEIVRWSTAVLRQALSHSLPGQGAAGGAGGAGLRAAPVCRSCEMKDQVMSPELLPAFVLAQLKVELDTLSQSEKPLGLA